MKSLLALLFSFLGTTPSINLLLESKDNFQLQNKIYEKNDSKKLDSSISNDLRSSINLEKNNEKINFINKWIETIEIFLENELEKEESFKKDFLASLYFKNNQVTVNLEKMINYKNYDFYELMTNENFSKIWEDSFETGFLKFENDAFIFQEKNDGYIDGVWTEGHWYWGAYWRVHFSHWKVQELVKAFQMVRDVSGAIATISKILPGAWTLFGIGVGVLGVFLWSNFSMLEAKDWGNGSWFGVFGVVPFAGFGSN